MQTIVFNNNLLNVPLLQQKNLEDNLYLYGQQCRLVRITY